MDPRIGFISGGTCQSLICTKSIGVRYYNYMILHFAKQKTEMEGHSVR